MPPAGADFASDALTLSYAGTKTLGALSGNGPLPWMEPACKGAANISSAKANSGTSLRVSIVASPFGPGRNRRQLAPLYRKRIAGAATVNQLTLETANVTHPANCPVPYDPPGRFVSAVFQYANIAQELPKGDGSLSWQSTSGMRFRSPARRRNAVACIRLAIEAKGKYAEISMNRVESRGLESHPA